MPLSHIQPWWKWLCRERLPHNRYTGRPRWASTGEQVPVAPLAAFRLLCTEYVLYVSSQSDEFYSVEGRYWEEAAVHESNTPNTRKSLTGEYIHVHTILCTVHTYINPHLHARIRISGGCLPPSRPFAEKRSPLRADQQLPISPSASSCLEAGYWIQYLE